MNLTKIKVMVSKIRQVTVKLYSKKGPCGICGRKTMVDGALCKSFGNGNLVDTWKMCKY